MKTLFIFCALCDAFAFYLLIAQVKDVLRLRRKGYPEYLINPSPLPLYLVALFSLALIALALGATA